MYSLSMCRRLLLKESYLELHPFEELRFRIHYSRNPNVQYAKDKPLHCRFPIRKTLLVLGIVANNMGGAEARPPSHNAIVRMSVSSIFNVESGRIA